MRSGPNPPLTGAALCKAVMAIWCVCFCGMQWRATGLLSNISFNTLYGLFARWTRLGLWRRLLDRLRRTWRRTCGDAPEPSAMVIDNRSCRSAPSCLDRGIEGGKKILGTKINCTGPCPRTSPTFAHALCQRARHRRCLPPLCDRFHPGGGSDAVVVGKALRIQPIDAFCNAVLIGRCPLCP
jgi:hypothetical protein